MPSSTSRVGRGVADHLVEGVGEWQSVEKLPAKQPARALYDRLQLYGNAAIMALHGAANLRACVLGRAPGLLLQEYSRYHMKAT